MSYCVREQSRSTAEILYCCKDVIVDRNNDVTAQRTWVSVKQLWPKQGRSSSRYDFSLPRPIASGRCHMKVSSSRDPLAYSRKLEQTSKQTCPKALGYFPFPGNSALRLHLFNKEIECRVVETKRFFVHRRCDKSCEDFFFALELNLKGWL